MLNVVLLVAGGNIFCKGQRVGTALGEAFNHADVGLIDLFHLDGDAADISLDGTRIAVAQKSTGLIRILSVNGRHLWEFTVKNYGVGLDWAADGKGLFFCGSTARGLAVVHVDLRGNTQILWQ